MKISVDDGAASDLRVFALARKYNIEAIFYWPVEWHSLAFDKGYKPLPLADALMIAKTCEIGSHTVTHRHLTAISLNQAYYEISSSQIMLQKLFGKKVRKFCPPRGYTNENLTKYTLNRYDSQRLTKGKGLVHVHPNSGANDNKPWREAIDKDTKELFMHSYELDRYDMWKELEDYFNAES